VGARRQPGRCSAFEITRLIEVRNEPLLFRLPSRQLPCPFARRRAVQTKEVSDKTEWPTASSGGLATTGRFRRRPMTSAISRVGTLSRPKVPALHRLGRASFDRIVVQKAILTPSLPLMVELSADHLPRISVLSVVDPVIFRLKPDDSATEKSASLKLLFAPKTLAVFE
jgi:hypothetical protein